MKKNNIRLTTTLLTLAISGSAFSLTSCGSKIEENKNGVNISATTNHINNIFTEYSINYLLDQIEKQGVICKYNKEINGIEIVSKEEQLTDEFYSLLNKLLLETSATRLCSYSKDLSLDLAKINLSNINILGLFVNDSIISYINSSILNLDDLYLIMDSSSLEENVLNLNIKGVKNATILSGNSNIIELGSITNLSPSESKLILNGVSITEKTTFNCENTKIYLTGSFQNSKSFQSLKQNNFTYNDIESGVSIKYNPANGNIDETINTIELIHGIKKVKKENM